MPHAETARRVSASSVLDRHARFAGGFERCLAMLDLTSFLPQAVEAEVSDE
jgi:hypothetical protein